MTERSNRDVARQGLEAWSSGDLDTALDGLHPEIEWHLTFPLPDLPADKSVYRGKEEVRQAWSAFHSGLESLTAEVEEFVWEGRDALVLRTRVSGRGKSGLEADSVLFYVMRVRDDMVVLWRGFGVEGDAIDFAQGLEA
jgi:ketosteroid isomerase-like protein